MAAALATQLRNDGWHLYDEALEATVARVGSAEVQRALLDADLTTLGAAALPNTTNIVQKFTLRGTFVVQLVRVADVSRPLQTADRAGSGARRLLRLTVTDGHREAKAAEYQPIKQLQPDMRPGTKLQLCNVVIFMGVMLLTEQSVRVLGGRVDALADEWEAERQYTGMHRPDIDLDRPKFHPFDPTSEAARRIPSSSLEVQVAASGAPCTLANPSGADVMPRTDVSTAPAFAPRTKPKLPPKRGEASTAPVKPPALPAPPVKMVGVKTVAAVSQQPVATPAMEEEIPAVASPLTTPAPPAGPRNKEAVRDRLLERFTGTHGGRSTHEGRGGRGRKGEQDDTAGSLTLDEWEQLQAHQAQRNAAHARLRAARRESHVSGSSADTRAAHSGDAESQMRADEAMAHALQRQLDLEQEDSASTASLRPEAVLTDMFDYSRPLQLDDRESERGGGRGWGRGRSDRDRDDDRCRGGRRARGRGRG